jgi:hypothetical protein
MQPADSLFSLYHAAPLRLFYRVTAATSIPSPGSTEAAYLVLILLIASRRKKIHSRKMKKCGI